MNFVVLLKLVAVALATDFHPNRINIDIRSEACEDPNRLGPECGYAFIRVNGVDRSLHSRGHNFVVLQRNGQFVRAATFDTHGVVSASWRLKNFVDSIVLDNQIVLVAVQDEAWFRFNTAARNALKSLGAKDPQVGYRGSYALIGYKGSIKPSWVREAKRDKGLGPTLLSANIPTVDLPGPITPGVTDGPITPGVTDGPITPGVTDGPITPGVTDGPITPGVTDGPIIPGVTDGPITPGVTDGPITPGVTDGPITPGVTDGPITPGVTDGPSTNQPPIGPHTPGATVGPNTDKPLREIIIDIRSEACEDPNRLGPECGYAFIRVNGVDRSLHGRGHNFVVLQRNGQFVTAATFDTHNYGGGSWRLKNFVDNIVLDNQIVLVAVQDEAWWHFQVNAINALRSLGAKDPEVVYRGSYALIGYKGPNKPSWVREAKRGKGLGPTVLKATIPAIDVPEPITPGVTVRPITGQPPIGSCGIKPFKSTRIVGGVPARSGEWPWQAMLRKPGGRQFCGGSLIAPQWVLTATHCVTGNWPSNVKVRLGAHQKYVTSGYEQDFDVTRIITHQLYQRPVRYANDIALLKLSRPAILNDRVNLVCLGKTDYGRSLEGKRCFITGWGTTRSGGSSANILMEASVPIKSRQSCDVAYPGKLHNSMICAGYDRGGVDSCQGDSGGPLACEFNGKWWLEGVTSWGHGCARPGKFGVYANVRKLNAWVLARMAENA